MRLLVAVCEGDHDVAFVHRSARSLGSFVPFDRPLGEYPIPLGAGSTGSRPAAQFLVTRARRANPEFERIDDAIRPRLPALAGALYHDGSDTLLLLIRAHGMNRVEVAPFLNDLFDTFDAVAGTEITECATAFFVDADDAGCEARAAEVAASFGDSWGVAELPPSTWVIGGRGPVGAFVFCAPESTTGSLEDALAPLMKAHSAAYWAAAEVFIDNHATPDAKVRKAARHRLKAVITACGQFERPGNPMSEMLRYKALPPAIFTTSPEALRVALFLGGVPWTH